MKITTPTKPQLANIIAKIDNNKNDNDNTNILAYLHTPMTLLCANFKNSLKNIIYIIHIVQYIVTPPMKMSKILNLFTNVTELVTRQTYIIVVVWSS